MKVNIQHYRHSSVEDNYISWTGLEEDDYKGKPLYKIVCILDRIYQRFLDVTVNRRLKESVKIEPGDASNADQIIARIVHPLLLDVKKYRYVHPTFTNEEIWELPVQVQLMRDESKWDWILDEMIWAFEQSINQYEISVSDRVEYMEYITRVHRGFQLFGKYYTGLWI